MNRSTPGLPVYHQLPEFMQTHVHRVGDAIQPFHPLLSPSLPAPNPSQHQGLFQWVNSSHRSVYTGLYPVEQHYKTLSLDFTAVIWEMVPCSRSSYFLMKQQLRISYINLSHFLYEDPCPHIFFFQNLGSKLTLSTDMFVFLIVKKFFLAAPCTIWDLRFPTRDWIYLPCRGNSKS